MLVLLSIFNNFYMIISIKFLILLIIYNSKKFLLYEICFIYNNYTIKSIFDLKFLLIINYFEIFE